MNPINMRVAIILLLLIPFTGTSQHTIHWESEVVVCEGTIYGNLRPRLVLTADNTPLVVFSKGSTGKVFSARWTGSGFATPTDLLPNGESAYVATWTGPDVAAEGDTVVVVYKQNDLENGHVYTIRSTDGGITFSDTIRTDSHLAGVAWLPSLEMDENGNPSVIYMAHDPIWVHPRYFVTHSLDQGLTYQPEMDIASSIPNEACDCCPAEYVIEGNQHALLFRNNASNIRDIYAIYSADDGVSYSGYTNVDQLNWNITSCPSTGPDGIFNNSDLYTVFASRASGNYRVYISSSSTSSGINFQSRTMMEPPVNVTGSQNFPRIDGSNDTIVMIWQESETSNSEIYASVTTSADVNELVSSKGMVNVSTAGAQSNPDIAYADGFVHAVFQDASTGNVIYRRGIIGVAGVSEQIPDPIDVYPNPNETGAYLLNGITEVIGVFDVTGKAIDHELNTIDGQLMIELMNSEKGIYYLLIANNANMESIKLIRL